MCVLWVCVYVYIYKYALWKPHAERTRCFFFKFLYILLLWSCMMILHASCNFVNDVFEINLISKHINKCIRPMYKHILDLCINTRTHAHMHTRIHAHTHTRTQHTHTHTNSYTQHIRVLHIINLCNNANIFFKPWQNW